MKKIHYRGQNLPSEGSYEPILKRRVVCTEEGVKGEDKVRGGDLNGYVRDVNYVNQ